MGGWDQKSYESDLQYGRRKTQESADAYNNRNKHDNYTEINSDDVEAAGGCIAGLLILPFLFLWWSVTAL